MQCKFDTAWVGYCKQEANESGFCEQHQNMKCCVCGAQANRECSYTGQFVCGSPLCENCEPGNPGDSTKGLGWGFVGHTHRKKSKE